MRIHLRGDVDFGATSSLPLLGSPSLGVRVVSESWSASRDSLLLEIVGPVGSALNLYVRNPDEIASVEGGTFVNHGGAGAILVHLPRDGKVNQSSGRILVHFKAGHSKGQRR